LKDSRQEQEKMRSKAQWLVFFRLVAVSFLLAIVAIVQFKLQDSLPVESIRAIYVLVTVTYIISVLYIFLLKTISNVSINIYIQCLLDIMSVTVLVYFTGGIESVYSTLYPLVIIYSVLFLGRKGGLLVASLAGIAYGLLLDLEFYGTIHPVYDKMHQYDIYSGHVFMRICIYIVSFYVVALLASFVVETEKKTKTLLSEKESAFDKLDILHKSIIESVGSGIITLDPDGRIKSFNRAAEGILGISSCSVMDRIVIDVFPDFPAMRNKIKEVERKSDPSSGRFEMTLSSEESDKILGFSVYPLIDQEGDSIGDILIFQDLTYFKEMEREIEKNKRLALMGEMSTILAHELRSPIASISGSIKLLMESLDLEGSDRRLMEIVLMGKDQLENLVRDFLLFAKPDKSKRSNTDIVDIIAEVIESIRLSSEWNEDIVIAKNLCIQNKVFGNSSEIKQVLWNIILNALQAMPDGGRLDIETTPDVNGDSREFLKISVKDSGCGIAKEYLNKVREPFYTMKEKGTGLGLAVVSRIVESHGGSFRINSEPQKGTECIIFLPIDEPAEEQKYREV